MADETVDGPGIAAAILQAMGQERQERLMEAIQRKAPEISTSIEEKLYNLEKLLEQPAATIARLLETVDNRDLVLSLKRASPELTEHLLNGVSERRRALTVEELQDLPPVRLTEVTRAQRRILKKFAELQLQSTNPQPQLSGKDVWV